MGDAEGAGSQSKGLHHSHGYKTYNILVILSGVQRSRRIFVGVFRVGGGDIRNLYHFLGGGMPLRTPPSASDTLLTAVSVAEAPTVSVVGSPHPSGEAVPKFDSPAARGEAVPKFE